MFRQASSSTKKKCSHAQLCDEAVHRIESFSQVGVHLQKNVCSKIHKQLHNLKRWECSVCVWSFAYLRRAEAAARDGMKSWSGRCPVAVQAWERLETHAARFPLNSPWSPIIAAQ